MKIAKNGPTINSGTSRASYSASPLARSISFLMVLALTIALLPIGAFAAPGDLDPSFDTDGKVITNINSSGDGRIHAIAQQTDGKIVMVGGKDVSALVRYNVDGSLDTSFGSGGKVVLSFRANAVTIERGTPDGDRIVVVGTEGDDIAVARFVSDGTPDGGFGTTFVGKVLTDFNGVGGGYTTAEGTSVTIDSSGRIVVGGDVKNGSELEDFLLLRYKSDGTLDTLDIPITDFEAKGWVTTSMQRDEQDRVYDIVIQADGSILLVGSTKAGSFAMARYFPDGNLDVGFGTDGKVFSDSAQTGYGVAQQADGKIVVIGAKGVRDESSLNCTDSGGRRCEYLDFYIARYNLDGTLDTSFGTRGEVTTNINARGNDDQGRDIAIQADGKIIGTGFSDTATYTFPGEDPVGSRINKFSVVRFNSDGTLDTSFSDDGKDILDFGKNQEESHAVLYQTDGKIVVGGTSQREFALARYEGDEIAETPTPETPTPEETPETPTPEETPETPTPEETPETPTPEETPETPTPEETPEEPVSGAFFNIATRGKVGTGADVLIGGFIIKDKTLKVIVHGIGPDMAKNGVENTLQDPVLAVYNIKNEKIAENDNWGDGNCTTDAPSERRPNQVSEACHVMTLEPGNYTVIVSGKNGTTGVGLVAVYLGE